MSELKEIVLNGQRISSVLPVHEKKYLIDIDDTVCEDIPKEEPKRMETATLFPDPLQIINQWYSEGHTITFFTSRIEEYREVTECWLSRQGFSYYGPLMGKSRVFNYPGLITTLYGLPVTRENSPHLLKKKKIRYLKNNYVWKTQ